jgi:hypothetical protein
MAQILTRKHPMLRSLRSENIILALSLFVALLTYIAEVSNTYLPGRWLVGCCGKYFLWTPVGCSLVLVIASLTFRLKTAWSLIVTSALALYVFIFFSNVAVQRWLDYAPVDKAYALQQSLMPLYRPSGTLLGLWLMTVGMRHLFSGISRHPHQNASKPRLN